MPVSFGGAGATAEDIWDYSSRGLSNHGFCKPSDNVKVSDDTEESTGSDTYAKVKEIRIAFTGKMRVSFDLKSSDGATVYGRIYKNGTALGTERSTTSTTYVTYTEDLEFDGDDLIQVYAKTASAGGGTADIRNFRVKFDLVDYGAVQ